MYLDISTLKFYTQIFIFELTATKSGGLWYRYYVTSIEGLEISPRRDDFSS